MIRKSRNKLSNYAVSCLLCTIKCVAYSTHEMKFNTVRPDGQGKGHGGGRALHWSHCACS